MSPDRRKKRKKVKFKTVTFKLSAGQKRSLINYCDARKTTPNKLIKKAIRRYIEFYASEVPTEFFVTEKQLDLFEEEKNEKLYVEKR
jgi:hypothetical protein